MHRFTTINITLILHVNFIVCINMSVTGNLSPFTSTRWSRDICAAQTISTRYGIRYSWIRIFALRLISESDEKKLPTRPAGYASPVIPNQERIMVSGGPMPQTL
jgi:hypothetical protein